MCRPSTAPGAQRSKKATARHYRRQAKKGGFGFSSTGWMTLVHRGPVAWARWVFIDLGHHEASCKWRRLMEWRLH